MNNCLRHVERRKRLPKAEFPQQLSENTETAPDAKIAFPHQCIAEIREIDRIVISLELESIKHAALHRS